MLKIRLARAGRHKTPFFRIVLTEHTRPIQSGYQDILGFYDPLKHSVNIDVEATKGWIAKGAKPTSRVAKILHQHTGDDSFKQYIVITERTRKSKSAPAEEGAPKAPAPVAAAPAPVKEEVKEETPVTDVVPEVKEELPTSTEAAKPEEVAPAEEVKVELPETKEEPTPAPEAQQEQQAE